MTGQSTQPDTPPKAHLISIGNFLAVAYWIMEAFFDSILIEDTSFTERLFPSDPNELWMRSLVSILFISFGLYAHRTYVRVKSLEKLNEDAGWLLKKALSNTIRGNFAICVHCKNIRDEDNQWVAPDRFIYAQTEAEFTRFLCDKCQVEHS